MRTTTTVVIDRRFRGPLSSANGGYAAGIVAEPLGGPAEVTLRLPPPLDTPLALERDGERAILRVADSVVAEARTADPELEPPPAPSWEEATAAAGPASLGGTEFAECFVCGTRPEGDGLEIHAGPVPGRDVVAAPWVVREASSEVVWAAIDCPGAYSLHDGLRGEPVLGRITARVERIPHDGERCIVVGWPLGEERRKLFAGTALFGESGDVIAVARQVWIRRAGVSAA